jgi:hypothetical protein
MVHWHTISQPMANSQPAINLSHQKQKKHEKHTDNILDGQDYHTRMQIWITVMTVLWIDSSHWEQFCYCTERWKENIQPDTALIPPLNTVLLYKFGSDRYKCGNLNTKQKAKVCLDAEYRDHVNVWLLNCYYTSEKVLLFFQTSNHDPPLTM